jgi:hypothetical protein
MRAERMLKALETKAVDGSSNIWWGVVMISFKFIFWKSLVLWVRSLNSDTTDRRSRASTTTKWYRTALVAIP